MKDYRAYINEGYKYTAEDKADVLKNFSKYLDSKYGENSTLYWSLGNGAGAYRDDRLTVGLKTPGAHVKTVCFLVSDTGFLTAYLDAEDNDLLRNSPVSNWSVGFSKASEMKAFEGARTIYRSVFC